MKIHRLLAVLLFVSSVSLNATAQESSEVASLRAKAEKGNGIAQYNLGLAYAEGRGLPVDPQEAFVWLSLARENGTRGRALDNVIASFDRSTLEAAQQRLAARRSTIAVPTPAAPVAAARAEAPGRTAPPAAKVSEPVATPTSLREDPALTQARQERDSLSGKLTELAAELASLRAERVHLTARATESTKAVQVAREASFALQEQNHAAEARAAELLRETQAAKTELARVQQALAALEQTPKPAPDTAALDQKIRELQATQTELEASRTFGREVEATLNKVTDQKTALEARLAALAATPSAPDLSGRVRELETQLAADRSALEAAKADASHTRQEAAALALGKAAVEQQLTEIGSLKATLEQNRSQLVASEQHAASLGARVAELEQQAARSAEQRTAAESDQKRITGLTGELTALQTEIAQLRQQPAKPKYPDLRDRVHELEEQVATGASALSSAKTESVRAREELAAAIQAQQDARRQLAAMPAAPTYPDLSGRVSELEATLNALRGTTENAAQVVEALKARLQDREVQLNSSRGEAQQLGQKLTQAELALNRAQESIITLQGEAQKLRQQPAAPAYPDLSGKVAALEEKLAAEKSATPAYPDLSGRVSELENQLKSLDTAAVASTQALAEARTQLALAQSAAPAYPDLSGRVRELESTLTQVKETSQGQIVALTAERDTARTAQNELGTALNRAEQEMTKLAAAQSSTAETARQIKELGDKYSAAEKLADTLRQERDALSGKMTDLVGNVATLQADRERMQKMLADAGRQMRDATAAANRIKELETQIKAHAAETDAARTSQAELNDAVAKLAQEKTELSAALQTARAAAPAFPDLSGKVAGLEAQLGNLQAALAAKPAAPAYPDLSGRVQELEVQVAAGLTAVASAKTETSNANQQVAALTQAREAAGTERSALQSELAQLREKAATPVYPDLSGKVRELEGQVVDLKNAAGSAAKELAEAQARLAAVPPAAPASPDLTGRVQELEGTITTLTQKLGTAEQGRTELAKQFDDYKGSTLAALRESTKQQAEIKMLESDKSSLRHQLDTVTAEAAEWRNQATTLKTQATTAVAAPVPDLSGRVKELESQVAAAESTVAAAKAEADNAQQQVTALTQAKENAEKAATTTTATPAYPDLSGRVRELESAATESARQLAEAGATQAELQRKLDGTATALQKAVKDQNSDESAQLRRERDELSGRLTTLAGELAQLRIDRERMQKMLADAGKQMRDATADASRIKELETQVAAAAPDLSGRVKELESQVATNLSAAASAKAEVDNLKQQMAVQTQAKEAAEAQAATLQTALATKHEAPAYPDLSGKVSELEAQVSRLQSAQAEKPAAPAYPDLSGRVSELEAKLAAAEKSTPPPVAPPAYPDLSGKVTELETALAETKRLLANEQTKPVPVAAVAGADPAELQKQLAEVEDKLAISLRGYTALEKERDALAARSSQAAEAVTAERNALATQVAALSSEVAQLKSGASAQTEALSQTAALASDKNQLANRLSQVEAQLAAAQAQSDRANQALASLQRTSAQGTNELTAARTLLQQLQGSNTVLASENYQLKTMLSRSTGATAPVLSSPVAVPTAGRTHLVASGDSLSRISQRYYGTATRWQEIFNANRDRISSEGVLRVGTTLRIP